MYESENSGVSIPEIKGGVSNENGFVNLIPEMMELSNYREKVGQLDSRNEGVE
ncbi:hypothetical protein KDN24_08825 [Bacillus sp. Bva_UNVM-123]